jgi:hypothetical protein
MFCLCTLCITEINGKVLIYVVCVVYPPVRDVTRNMYCLHPGSNGSTCTPSVTHNKLYTWCRATAVEYLSWKTECYGNDTIPSATSTIKQNIFMRLQHCTNMYLVLTTRIQNINKQLHFHSRRGVHLSIVCVKSDTCYRTELKKK